MPVQCPASLAGGDYSLNLMTSAIRASRSLGHAMATAPETIAAGSWARYIACALVTAMSAGAAYLLALMVLERSGRLPPPAFTNSLCADAKLAFLRDATPQAPTALVLGSSAAWRGIASEEIVRRHPGARPLNGSFCGLQVNQTEFVANYLLRRYPSVQGVLLLLSPIDMGRCSVTDARLFDKSDVDAYLAGKGPAWSYHFRYFDPVSLVRNASLMKAAREDRIPFYSLIFTPYGDGPQTTNASRKLDQGRFVPIDPACVASLRRLARSIADGGRQLTVASIPLLSVENSNPRGAIHDQMVQEVKSAVVGTDARFWDGERIAQVDPGDFVDPIHLRWTGARRFTSQLVVATGFGALK